MDNMQYTGEVLKIIFGPTSDSFVILSVRLSSGEIFVAKGNVAAVREGGKISFIAKLVNDKKYGQQLSIVSVVPSTSMSMKDFLCSGMIKGVTEPLAIAMYNKFGEDIPTIMRDSPEKLLELPRMNEERLQTIIESWNDLYTARDAITFFSSAGVTESQLKKIKVVYKTFSDAYEAVKHNPWILTSRNGIVPFPVSDSMATALGFSMDCNERMQAAQVTALRRNEKNGHCYLTESGLMNDATALVGGMYAQNLHANLHDIDNYFVYVEDDAVYAAYTRMCEESVADFVTSRAHITDEVPQDLAEKLQEVVFRKDADTTFNIDAVQASAVAMACAWGISVITGGPGTGKTTVLQALLFALRNADYCGQEYDKKSIFLCAPTGKAAQRMRMSTGWDASTIHRMLGLYADDDVDEQIGAAFLDGARVVIVDEASMIDVKLMEKLVKSLPQECKLILVGDVNQLPSVGPGNVLKDITYSGRVPVASLSAVYRTSEGSRIFDNARAVLEGDYSKFSMHGDDFTFIDTSNDVKTESDYVVDTVAAVMSTGLTPFDFMVLSPMYKGDVGVNALNKRLQEMCNPDGQLVYSGRTHFLRVGDKVIQTVNNNDKNVFNGDVGRVISYGEFDERFPLPIDEESQRTLTEEETIELAGMISDDIVRAAKIRKNLKDANLVIVDFGENHIEAFTQDELSELALAYVTTVHKAQGSEAHTVIVVASTTQYIMLYRQLFYTAMTRARRHLYVVGTESAIIRATMNVGNTNRRTRLLQRIISG